MDFHAFGYLQSILSLICITWQVCTILQYNLKWGLFNANPSEKTPALSVLLFAQLKFALK